MTSASRHGAAGDGAPQPDEGGRVVRALGCWFDGAKRDLPWRRTTDPYAVWVSEVMLQQTRVDTVIPYYRRFMRRFPTVVALAQADEEAVLAVWSGLGYYRRAHRARQAARRIVAEHGGRLPATVRELRALPGVGRYTAGAVASIAFGERAPVVDGNVARVLARLCGWEDDMNSVLGRRRAWTLAASWVPRRQPGRFNQALMELGATVCLPQAPSCSRCPLRRRCRAHRQGRCDELPRLGGRRPPRPQALVAVVVSGQPAGRVLMAQRPATGLYAGLWEPPMADGGGAGTRDQLLSSLGFRRTAATQPCGRLRHVLTHRRLEVEVHALVARGVVARRLPKGLAPYRRLCWADPQALALSTLARRVLSRAASGQESGR